jgi:hypothetical protein
VKGVSKLTFYIITGSHDGGARWQTRVRHGSGGSAILFLCPVSERIRLARKEEAFQCPILCRIWNPDEPNSSSRFARLGHLRSGFVSNTSGRCGKPNCHCHRPGQPAHGKNARLTYKVQGKTITESLPTPASQKEAEREIAEFRNFERLIRAFIEVSTEICRARPAEAQPVSKKRLRRSAKRRSAN